MQKTVLLVELDELEGGTRTITLLFGEVVVLVQTAFAVLWNELADSMTLEETRMRTFFSMAIAA